MDGGVEAVSGRHSPTEAGVRTSIRRGRPPGDAGCDSFAFGRLVSNTVGAWMP